jgi:hypothetical protein
MKKFNEWLTNRNDLSELNTDKDLGMEIQEDLGLVKEQLSQFAIRIVGILHNVSEGNKKELVEKFVNDLKSQIN